MTSSGWNFTRGDGDFSQERGFVLTPATAPGETRRADLLLTVIVCDEDRERGFVAVMNNRIAKPVATRHFAGAAAAENGLTV